MSVEALSSASSADRFRAVEAIVVVLVRGRVFDVALFIKQDVSILSLALHWFEIQSNIPYVFVIISIPFVIIFNQRIIMTWKCRISLMYNQSIQSINVIEFLVYGLIWIIFLLVKRQIFGVDLYFFVKIKRISNSGSIWSKSFHMNYKDSRQLFDSKSHLSNSQIFTFVTIVFILAI